MSAQQHTLTDLIETVSDYTMLLDLEDWFEK